MEEEEEGASQSARGKGKGRVGSQKASGESALQKLTKKERDTAVSERFIRLKW